MTHSDGLRINKLLTGVIHVPDEVAKEPLGSLNHAFTRLSETFEPWRISHTGNVFTRVLYQEADDAGTWFPLEVLRQASTATDAQPLARKAWKAVCGAQAETGTVGTQSELALLPSDDTL